MSTPDPIDVTFTVDLSTVVAHSYRQTGEDDYAQTDITLGERVAEILADRIYQARRHDDHAYWSSSAVKEAVDRAISERVEAAMGRSVTPTDEFGQPKGEPTTMGQIISDRLSAWFKENAPNRDSYGYKSGRTNIQVLLDPLGNRIREEDVDGAIKAARAQLVATLQAEAAKVLAETLARATGVTR